jgi:hypothetical protein
MVKIARAVMAALGIRRSRAGYVHWVWYNRI